MYFCSVIFEQRQNPLGLSKIFNFVRKWALKIKEKIKKRGSVHALS